MSCASCHRRARLILSLAGHLEAAHVRSTDMLALFDLDEDQLLEALAGRDRRRIKHELDRESVTEDSATCSHEVGFPEKLRGLPGSATQLVVAEKTDQFESLVAGPTVAIVGSRRCSSYGLSVACSLAAEIAAAGVTVVSGMALGIDSAAHEGALSSSGRTVAVLAADPSTAYPRSKRALHQRIVEHGAVVAEFSQVPGVRKWMFPARNRLIAGLSDLTLVVEATERSGSLITALFAREFGRELAAVPGQISSPLARGSNALISDGAQLVMRADDVLDLVLGVGTRPRTEPQVPEHLSELFKRVASESGTLTRLCASDLDIDQAAKSVAELELLGLVTRDGSGRYQAVA